MAGYKYTETVDPSSLISVKYVCEGCGFTCVELQRRDSQIAPDCPHCDEGQTSGPVPSTTAIGERKASRAGDQVYRAEEEGSAIRAEALGDPSLKITDMKDGFYGGGLKEGDTTAVTKGPPINPVTQYAAATGFNNGSFWGKGGANAGGGITLEGALTKAAAAKKSGDFGVGARTINDIQGGNGPMQFPQRVRPT